MSDSTLSAPWWAGYGLRHRPFDCAHDWNRSEAVPCTDPRIALLESAEPVLFSVPGPDGRQEITADELRSRMADAWVRFQAPIEADADTRSQLGWATLEAAALAPDAGVVIAEGGWAGSTRTRARQRCWSLFQYEPQGCSMPVRTIALPGVKEWLGGGVPDVRGYAGRARALEAEGVTPEAYRRGEEAIGKVTFTWSDSVTGVVPPELAGQPDAAVEYARQVARDLGKPGA